MRPQSVVLVFLGSQWLGHGRKTEALLNCFALSYGVSLLLLSQAGFDTATTYDLAWHGYTSIIALALILKGVSGGYGLLANIFAWPFSRECRFFGAFVGSGIWIWFLAKSILIGNLWNFTSFAAFWFFVASIQIMATALANLPRPGAAGVV